MPFLYLQEEYSLRISPSLWLSSQRQEYSPSFCRYTTSRASSSWVWRWAARRSSCMRISMGNPLPRITPFSVQSTSQMESKLTLYLYFFFLNLCKGFGLNCLDTWSLLSLSSIMSVSEEILFLFLVCVCVCFEQALVQFSSTGRWMNLDWLCNLLMNFSLWLV